MSCNPLYYIGIHICEVCKSTLKEKVSRNWDEKLSKLSVQSKFLDACDLEKSNRVWSRILDGLPSKQLSFILRASSDTLPTRASQSKAVENEI